MKLFILVIISFLWVSLESSGQSPEREYDYLFFENSIMPGYYFFSEVGYTDNSYVRNINGKLPVSEEVFFTPPNALFLEYTNGEGSWEASVDFERIRGNEFFKNLDYLSVWIYAGNTDPGILPEVSLGFYEKDRRSKKVVIDERSKALDLRKYLSGTEKNGWQLVKIPVKEFEGPNRKPTKIYFTQKTSCGVGKIYLDQLELLPEVAPKEMIKPGVISAEGYERHVDVIWERIDDPSVKYIQIYSSDDAKNYKAIGVQRPYYNRFTDFTGEVGKSYYYKISFLNHQYEESVFSNPVRATTRQFTDEELLDMVQEASFRYYWEGAEEQSGLALENIPGRENMIATGASGFGIMAILVGVERAFINREAAVDRMLKITSFLENCDKFHGAVSHFIDGPTGKVEAFFGERDNGGDLVETSFLFQGLLASRQYFDRDDLKEKLIRSRITKLWEGVEWNWYDREKENKYLTWHWSPDKEWLIDHKLIGWNETMITYILAMASPTYPIDKSMYYKGWASQEERAVKYRKAWGRTDDGSYYTNGNSYHGIPLSVGVGNGGPLFFIHYSYLGFDPHRFTDRYTNYFENNRNIALINWRYCTENPKRYKAFSSSFWGLTASDGPWGYKAIEPKADIDNGTMAPTGALASFPYTPEQSMEALKNMYRNHGKYMWGEYGFRDAVNFEENWAARIYMGLNQAPVTVMIENYRSGLIWDLFMKNIEIKELIEHFELQKN